MTKRDGIASDPLPEQAATSSQDESVAGLSGQPESIQPIALLAQVLERANLQRALKQVRRNKGAPGIDKMTVDATTDKRLILNDGNLVISSGEMKDHYVLGRGPSVNLNSRWSATLIKDNDRWLLASFSASTNAFDNEVVSLYLTSQKYTVSAAAGLIGIGLGLVLSRVMNRRSKA